MLAGGSATTPTLNGNLTTDAFTYMEWTAGSVNVGGGVIVTNNGTFLADSKSRTMGGNAQWNLINQGLLLEGEGTFKGTNPVNKGNGRHMKVASLDSGGSNTFIVDGSFLQQDSATTEVQSGTLVVTGAFTQVSGSTAVDGNQTLSVGGALAENAGSFTLGDQSGGGNLTETGGTQVASGAGFSGYGTITGGDLTNAGEFDVQTPNPATGTLTLAANYTQTAGTTTVESADAFSLNGAATINAGTFTLANRTGSASLSAPGGFVIGSSATVYWVGSIYGDVSDAGAVSAIGGTIAVTGSYTQTGQGTTTLTGTTLNASGAVDLQGGTLTSGGGNVTAGAGMTVEANGVLVGNGVFTITGTLINSGLIDILGGTGPGSSPGSLVVHGDYTQTSSGVLDVHLYSQGNDALSVTGTATLDGTLNVFLGYGFMPSPGNVFVLISYGARSGTFATLNLPTLSFGQWSPRYDDPNYPNAFSLWDTF